MMANEKSGELAVKSQPGMLVISEEVVDNYMQTSQMLTSKFQQWLIPEVDFTTKIFGRGKKPTLLDPGAGKLIGFFLCRPRHRIMERFYDKDEDGFETVRYVMATEIIQESTGRVVAEGVGSCTSDEKKYKYRWFFASELEKMGVNQEERHKLPTRITGRGATQYRSRNPEIPDLDNTILKMASKRSEVDGCLQLPGVAAVFTQDVGVYKQVQPKEVEVEQPPGKEKKPTKEKPADSDKVKKIREQARRDLEKRRAEEEESEKPPEEEPAEEQPLDIDPKQPLDIDPREPPEEPEPEEEAPPQGPPRSVEEVTERIASSLAGHSELVKVSEYEDYYRIGRRKTLDKEIEDHLDVIVSEMGGEFNNDSNAWRIYKK